MPRRTSTLTRERQRDRYLDLPEDERKAWAQKMHDARAAVRARRPERLQEVEDRMDALGIAYREPDADRRAIRRELRDLGQERMRLRWGD